MSIKLAEEFLKLLDFNLDKSNLQTSECFLAIDDRYLATKDISLLVNSKSRYLYGKDTLESLYDNLIAKWLVSDIYLEPTQWGVYMSEGTVVDVPIQLNEPFRNVERSFTYKYGSFSATPDTLVLLMNDVVYTKKLFTVWCKLKSIYPKFLYLCRSYTGNTEDFVTCLEILRNRFYHLNVIFLHSFIRTAGMLEFLKDNSPEMYSLLSTKSCNEFIEIYGDTCLSNKISTYLDLLT